MYKLNHTKTDFGTLYSRLSALVVVVVVVFVAAAATARLYAPQRMHVM